MTASPKLIANPSRTALDRLHRFLEERRQKGMPAANFEEYEKELHAIVCEVECDALGEELERHDIDVPVIVIEGEMYRRVLRCAETYFSQAGEVRAVRSLYAQRAEAGERALCPLELQAGIVEGRWTPRAAKQAGA